MPPRKRNEIARELTSLGLRRGDCVMMHSSLSALGPVDDAELQKATLTVDHDAEHASHILLPAIP